MDDEIEGYLQCFDAKYRNGVKERISHLNYKDKKQSIIEESWYFQNPSITRMLLDLGIHKNLGFGDIRMREYEFDEITRILIDRGYPVDISFLEQPKLQQFLRCRDCARNAAIAVLSLFSAKDACVAAVGRNRKDVGRIIGRAIWESRGLKEWTN